MPIAKVQLPDGRIGRFEVPEGTTPDQVLEFANSNVIEPQNPFTFARDAVESGRAEAPQGFSDRMSQDYEKMRQGIEKGSETDYSVAEKLYNVGGEGIKYGANALLNVVGSGARYANDMMPEEVKLLGKLEAEKLKRNPVIKAVKEPAMQGAQYVGEQYGEFKKENPRAAFNLENTADYLGVIPVGKVVGAGKELATKKMANVLEKMATPKKLIPDSEQFAAMSKTAYDKALSSGERFAPDVSNNFVTAFESAKPRKIANAVETELSKELESSLGKYRGLQGRGLGIDEVDIIDKDLSNLKEQAYNAGKNQLGSELSNIQNTLRGSVADSPSGQALAEGRDFFRKKYQMEDIERIFRNAEGRPNEASIIQTGFRNLANQARKKGSGYTAAQIALMDKAAKGGLSIDALKLGASKLIPIAAGASGGLVPAVGAYVANLASGAGATALQTAKGMKLAESVAKGLTVDAPPTKLNKMAQVLMPRREITEYPAEKLAKPLLLPSPDDFKGGGFGAPSAEKLAGIQAIKEAQGYTPPIYMGDKAAPEGKLIEVRKVAGKDYEIYEGIDPSLIDFKAGDASLSTAESRAAPLINMVKQGEDLPPVRLIKKTDGRYEVEDGNARIIAYKEANKPIPRAIITQQPATKLPVTAKELEDGLSARAKRDLENPPSWVIRDKITGESQLETTNPDVVSKINPKYEAVPISEHLANLNGQTYYKGEAASKRAKQIRKLLEKGSK